MDTGHIGWRATAGSTDIQSLISGLQMALEQEIEEVSGIRNRGILRVKNGKRIYQDTHQSIYRFLITDEITIPDDTPLETIINGKSATGSIVATDLEGVNIAFGEDLGDYIQELSLKRSDEKLLKEQIEKLRMTTSGELQFNASGAMKLFGFIEPGKLNRQIHPVNLASSDFRPNIYQKDAIIRSLSQEVTFI